MAKPAQTKPRPRNRRSMAKTSRPRARKSTERLAGKPPDNIATEEPRGLRHLGFAVPDVLEWAIPYETPFLGTVRDVPVMITAHGYAKWPDRTTVDSEAVKAEQWRKGAERTLSSLEAHFNKTKNPVFAWAAFTEALGHGVSVPEWVEAYLIRVAWRLHAMCFKNTPRRKISPAVYLALEFDPTPRNNPFRAITNMVHDLRGNGKISWTFRRPKNTLSCHECGSRSRWHSTYGPGTPVAEGPGDTE